mmetsp:Transcript_9878/g.17299  ORF Transcript_9878/g.17299 Transcript_9878/m.17299 type:complete len:204 (-) Transcript_9878:165-776(-)
MPFPWFSGNDNPTVSGAATGGSSSGRGHARKVSLTSSSGHSSARLADVRAKTKTSYLRKGMTQSGDLSTSRGRRSSSSAAAVNSGSCNPMNRRQVIVAVEPDADDSRHRRIDQGLLDASKEAQNLVLGPQNKAASWSWASPFSSPSVAAADAAPDPASSLPPPERRCTTTSIHSKTEHGINPTAKVTLKHRRTVSYNKTYRVP